MSIPNRLRGCRARIERANQAAWLLEDSIAAYLKAENRFSVEDEFDVETSEYVFKFALKEKLPMEWGLLLSEVVHHLRATLDNLVWALHLERGTVPPDSAAFPRMYKKESHYRNWRRPDKTRGKRDPFEGFTQDDLDLIEQFQPWHPKSSSTTRYLDYLQWMSNIDKHRLLHAVSTLPSAYGDAGKTGIRYVQLVQLEDGSTKDLAEVPELMWQPNEDVAAIGEVTYIDTPIGMTPVERIRVKIEPKGPNPRLHLTAPIVHVTFTERELDVFTPTSDFFWLRAAVSEVFNALRPQFDPPP